LRTLPRSGKTAASRARAHILREANAHLLVCVAADSRLPKSIVWEARSSQQLMTRNRSRRVNFYYYYLVIYNPTLAGTR